MSITQTGQIVEGPVTVAASPALLSPTAPEDLLGNLDLLGEYTRSILTHTGLSYEEQERHTGVSASAVYAIAQGRPERCHLFAVKRFAHFAAYRAGAAEMRIYWQALWERLDQDEKGRLSSPSCSHISKRSSVGTEAQRTTAAPETSIERDVYEVALILLGNALQQAKQADIVAPEL